MASVGGVLPLKIQESDLTGDCTRLNRRFDVDESRISTLETEVAALSGGSSTTTTSGTGTIIETHVVLSVASTTINSPATPSGSSIWVLRLDQDTTGGRIVAWGANVTGGPKINATVNSSPNTMCIITFAWYAPNWCVCAVPILGVVIP